MIEVDFPVAVTDEAVRYAVITARCRGQWLLCRHKERTTWEIPGGHREPGETSEQAARRELWEESGAAVYTLHPCGYYRVLRDGQESFGALYYAEVTALDPLPPLEMAEVRCFESLPPRSGWTYPEIQPKLIERVQNRGWIEPCK